MENALTTVWPGIGDQPPPALQTPSNPAGYVKHRRQELGVDGFQILGRLDVATRDDEYVGGRSRIDVVERDDFLGLNDEVRGYVPGGNRTEEAVRDRGSPG